MYLNSLLICTSVRRGWKHFHLKILTFYKITALFSLLTISASWLVVTFPLLYLSLLSVFYRFLQRRGPPKNHHNNRRSSSRLAVQFHCAPSFDPLPPLFFHPACQWTLSISYFKSCLWLTMSFSVWDRFFFFFTVFVLLGKNWFSGATIDLFVVLVFFMCTFFITPQCFIECIMEVIYKQFNCPCHCSNVIDLSVGILVSVFKNFNNNTDQSVNVKHRAHKMFCQLFISKIV